MDESISPFRIANSIMQDKDFTGYYLLIEGKKDVKLYRRLINSQSVRVRSTSGKYNLREVFEILEQRGFGRKIGIRDADFLRLPDNPKYDASYAKPIFVTDGHDSEMMMIMAGALNDLLLIVSDDEKINTFRKKINSSIIDVALTILYPLGCLKLANKRHSLGLVFKPEMPDGNQLKIERFVCDKTWKLLDFDTMVSTVIDYSRNKTGSVKTKEEIIQRLNEIVEKNYPIHDIVHGHDISRVLLMIIKNGIGSKNKMLQNSDCVEDLLTACFDKEKFSITYLYKSIDQWQKDTGVCVFA